MAPSKRPRKYPPSLSHGRPATTHKQPSSLSSRKTRTQIRTHHTLSKSLTRALATNDTALATSLSNRLDLPAYQAASLTGQSERRGGDTSRALLAFLRQSAPGLFATPPGKRAGGERFRMLDVGALVTDTAAARSGLFEVTRIDLHSQAKGILEQDFMERPLPRGPGERFEILCLSLVLNFCPEARGRGEMLRRVCEFLVPPAPVVAQKGDEAAAPAPFPGLFLVLPAPCVMNSRYLDQKRLALIMQGLGFRLVEMKVSAKLAYYLWRWDGAPREKISFAKKEVRSGGSRNNFAIVLE